MLPAQHKAEMQSDHAPETKAGSCVDNRPSTDTKHSEIVDQAEKGELLLSKTFNLLKFTLLAFKICSPSL